ncbi:hypothetical protein [Desulforhopalus singaporensis]|uniref:hypothetical protein n=1 Tax=Desulforhopalus singaporensis TaxID=91360 RepID=UPI00115FF806|nr:hypothetical protein [Desulforhopalus singaporensis]
MFRLQEINRRLEYPVLVNYIKRGAENQRSMMLPVRRDFGIDMAVSLSAKPATAITTVAIPVM